MLQINNVRVKRFLEANGLTLSDSFGAYSVVDRQQVISLKAKLRSELIRCFADKVISKSLAKDINLLNAILKDKAIL